MALTERQKRDLEEADRKAMESLAEAGRKAKERRLAREAAQRKATEAGQK